MATNDKNVGIVQLDTIQTSLDNLQDKMHSLKTNLDELQSKLGFVSRVDPDDFYISDPGVNTSSDCVKSIQGKTSFADELDQQVRRIIIYLDRLVIYYRKKVPKYVRDI